MGRKCCVCVVSAPLSHHVSVVLVGEVERGQNGLELVEDLVVSRHVGGQDAPAARTEWKECVIIRRQTFLSCDGKVITSNIIIWDILICNNLLLTWWSPLVSVCTAPWSGFWRCCSLSATQKSPRVRRGKKSHRSRPDSAMPASPSPGSRRPRHSGGSPGERCRCSAEPVRSGR